jgi:hypothetical protein
MTVSCFYCGEQVNPDDTNTYRRIQGWERKAVSASRRGGSDVVLREHRDEFACMFCIDRLRRGVSTNQGSML